MRFYLGSTRAHWLWAPRGRWPWFVSRRLLDPRRSLHPATGPWALDSGGFTELSINGGWSIDARRYAASVRRFDDEIGQLEWAAPQDWMCEPSMLARTGLSVAEHQRRTVENLLELRTIAADLPIVPVLQGWRRDDYMRHVDDYLAAGIDVSEERLVGIGSVCRRARLAPMASLIVELHAAGIPLHTFGIKADGLARFGWALTSADSMAWSFRGRRAERRLCGGDHRAQNCIHCRTWAQMWADRATADSHGGPVQMTLDGMMP